MKSTLLTLRNYLVLAAVFAGCYVMLGVYRVRASLGEKR